MELWWVMHWGKVESVDIDCAVCCFKYLKDGESQLGGSGDKEQKCALCASGNNNCDFALSVIIVIN
jgi:hypothetical protein